jgi:hypothetical protein
MGFAKIERGTKAREGIRQTLANVRSFGPPPEAIYEQSSLEEVKPTKKTNPAARASTKQQPSSKKAKQESPQTKTRQQKNGARKRDDSEPVSSRSPTLSPNELEELKVDKDGELITPNNQNKECHSIKEKQAKSKSKKLKRDQRQTLNSRKAAD